MELLKHISKTGLVCFLLLALVAGALFAYSLELRRPWFGKAPVCPEIWLTSAPLLWAKEWRQEGPLTLRFGLFYDPVSIEKPTLASRELYSSYPPGLVLPLYALSLASEREPSLKMVMAYDLSNQVAVAALLACLVFLYLRRYGFTPIDAYLAALIPLLLVFFLPGPAFQFQMGYLHDSSVLLPFVAYVFLEFLREGAVNPRVRGLISAAQAALAFFGILCDWLFAFVALCVYLKRIAAGEMPLFTRDHLLRGVVRFVGRSMAFWASFGLAVLLFVLQLYYFNQFAVIAGRFRERSGLKSGGFLSFSLDNHFWASHIPRAYGSIGKILIYASFIALVLLLAYAMLRWVARKTPNAPMNAGLRLMFMLLMPCLFQTLVFPQHSSHVFHFFSTTKYVIPIATIPFVLLPATLLAVFNLDPKRLSWTGVRARVSSGADTPTAPRATLIPALCLLLAAAYMAHEFPRLTEQFPKPPDRDPVALGRFIEANTAYEDVVFTPDVSLATVGTPVQLAQNMKRVYEGGTPQTLYEKLKDVAGEYIVDWLVPDQYLDKADPSMLRLIRSAYDVKQLDNLRFYKVRRADFLRFCGEMGIAS